MLITRKIGTVDTMVNTDRSIDYVLLDWFETEKRIMHKTSEAGRNVQIKFLNENRGFQPGDVIFIDGDTMGVIDIRECEVLVIRPRNMNELATICYEIGNKHLPLFYQEDELLVAYDSGLFAYLRAAGYNTQREMRKLTNALRTTVAPHGSNGKSLFTRIMQLTTEK